MKALFLITASVLALHYAPGAVHTAANALFRLGHGFTTTLWAAVMT
jgi:hypothetical protein